MLKASLPATVAHSFKPPDFNIKLEFINGVSNTVCVRDMNDTSITLLVEESGAVSLLTTNKSG